MHLLLPTQLNVFADSLEMIHPNCLAIVYDIHICMPQLRIMKRENYSTPPIDTY